MSRRVKLLLQRAIIVLSFLCWDPHSNPSNFYLFLVKPLFELISLYPHYIQRRLFQGESWRINQFHNFHRETRHLSLGNLKMSTPKVSHIWRLSSRATIYPCLCAICETLGRPLRYQRNSPSSPGVCENWQTGAASSVQTWPDEKFKAVYNR